MALYCHKIFEAKFKKGRNVPDYQPTDCSLEADHIPLVDSDARHLLSWAEPGHEPLHSGPEVDDDGDVEEREKEAEHVELVRLVLIEGAAAAARALEKANTSDDRLRGEASLEDGGSREDGVDDEKERGDNDPVELVEQSEVRPSLSHLKMIQNQVFRCSWCNWCFCRVWWIMCILLCKLLLVVLSS